MTNEFNPDWMCVCGDLTTLGVVHRKDGPCYYPEPKREWVGLTVGEIAEIAKTLERGNFFVAIQNIETKIGRAHV